MKKMIWFVLLFSFFVVGNISAQNKVLFAGNVDRICFQNPNLQISSASVLPDSIENYDAIFIFSGAQSILNEADLERLLVFLKSGKGLYLGSENWPLQAESNQLTTILYAKQTWGNFNEEKAEVNKKTELIEDTDSFPAGTTTVSMPLDFRLKVVAWVNDEPLIQCGEFESGKIIIDGGYSRFYCREELEDEISNQILVQFINYLIIPKN